MAWVSNKFVVQECSLRTNRHLLRLWFLLMILLVLWGGWYADRQWQAMTSDLEINVSSETDWISLVSALAENGIKFFQGATSAGLE
jgi:uncharacterized protein YgiM (DUF1202 family)